MTIFGSHTDGHGLLIWKEKIICIYYLGRQHDDDSFCALHILERKILPFWHISASPKVVIFTTLDANSDEKVVKMTT